MIAASHLRLPGVYFLPPPRAAGLALPPLDVTGFVGFAERGPLHLPVAVEDLNDYRAVFGGDWPLAREQGGQTVYAHLPSAVASFFANGGRRAYIVRVAGARTRTTRFRVPNLAALDEAGNVKLATIHASSPGRWSERLRIGARLRGTPLPAAAFTPDGARQLLWLTGGAPQAVQRGDLLRLTFTAHGRCRAEEQWLFPVGGIEAVPPMSGQPAQARLTASRVWQLWNVEVTSPLPDVVALQRLTPEGLESFDYLDAHLRIKEPRQINEPRQIVLSIRGQQAVGLQRGDLLRLRLSDGSTSLLPVAELQPAHEAISLPLSPPMPQIELPLEMMLRLPDQSLPSGSPQAPLCRVERLRFDLLLWEGEQRRPTLEELAFNRAHPRFWGEAALLESSALSHQRPADSDARRIAETGRLFRELQRETRREQDQNESLELAALAGLLAPLDEAESGLTFLPVGMPPVVTAGDLRGPLESEVGCDDLAEFDPKVFQDEYLARNRTSGGAALMTAALDRYYTQNRRLRGLHSLMFVDEVALLAVPDAAQRGWPAKDDIFSPPIDEITSPPITSPPLPICDAAQFHDCASAPPPPPPEPASTPTTTAPGLPVLKTEGEFDQDSLLITQRAMLNFCEARADVVGVLALPRHFEKRQCIEWQEELRRQLNLPPRRLSAAFGDATREIADLSYVAVYHPWLLVADANAPGQLRAVPPEGAVCGMTAARERARQVWVAPANVPLQGMRGLTPRLSTDDWAELFERQFNLLRQEPRDFRVMSAHTLSDESVLLQVSVRRLMILLRKVALQRGFDLVFESNNERFREAVRVTLETMLRGMYDRGAFAGASPSQAFRVVTDASVNPPQSVEQGRFIAQIQVAPSQPMEFITVLLTRAGDGLLQAIEG